MDGWDLQRLRRAPSLSDAWPGALRGLAAFDPTADPKKALRYGTENLLLTQERVRFRPRLEDGPDGVKSYSRQTAELPGLLLKTMLPVDLASWPALMVCRVSHCTYSQRVFVCARSGHLVHIVGERLPRLHSLFFL